MPELPEVETIRQGLERTIRGQRILRVQVKRRDLRWPVPQGLAARIRGARITALRRRGKYLLVDLDSARTMLVHLGMSGRLVQDGPARTHDHVIFHLDSGAVLRFHDPRRFGMIDLVPTNRLESHDLLKNMGPEPFDPALTSARFHAMAKGRSTSLKAFLLDQSRVAGIGNIYACEALFRARLHPALSAGQMTPTQSRHLLQAVRAVLTEAIQSGGSSLRDYVQSDGSLGYFQHGFAVYDRKDRPCPVCATPIARLTQSARSTFFCTKCQAA
ncbi:MAG: bifunctional DNA-formamidopyrimidine glycosylase/DNA-(apurinic or apyrimidinic site) lyase [Alphaproteobacteria bacterium]|nr:MAG: bifunctional DNA-formamidopyrimidine glycosylase/DNA-(apurinic or apyrimidinic site) lyase [Alphaproteobacteria bacterium]